MHRNAGYSKHPLHAGRANRLFPISSSPYNRDVAAHSFVAEICSNAHFCGLFDTIFNPSPEIQIACIPSDPFHDLGKRIDSSFSFERTNHRRRRRVVVSSQVGRGLRTPRSKRCRQDNDTQDDPGIIGTHERGCGGQWISRNIAAR